MTTEKNISRLTFWIISVVTIIICGLLTFLNLSEFYKIGILRLTDGYHFGGEGPTPYYYKTVELYSMVNLIWGLLFLLNLAYTTWTVVKGQRKKTFLVFGVTLFLLLMLITHGQIGI